MIKARVEWPSGPFLDRFRRGAIQRAEGAALYATDKAIRQSQRNLKATFKEVGIGRVAPLIAVTSDLKKGTVHRHGAEGFSASGVQYQSKRGERLDGMIESYGKGAEILPKKGQWLWIATPELGRKRASSRGKKITPALYNAAGLNQKIGPLVFIKGRHSGEALLIVRNVSTPVGRSGAARRLPKSGRPRGNRQAHEFIVAFVGIRRTTRHQRFDAQALLREAAARVPVFVEEYLRRNR